MYLVLDTIPHFIGHMFPQLSACLMQKNTGHKRYHFSCMSLVDNVFNELPSYAIKLAWRAW